MEFTLPDIARKDDIRISPHLFSQWQLFSGLYQTCQKPGDDDQSDFSVTLPGKCTYVFLPLPITRQWKVSPILKQALVCFPIVQRSKGDVEFYRTIFPLANELPGKNRDRRNVSVKVSYDEGQTWGVSKTIEDGWSAYSDIAVTPNGTIRSEAVSRIASRTTNCRDS